MLLRQLEIPLLLVLAFAAVLSLVLQLWLALATQLLPLLPLVAKPDSVEQLSLRFAIDCSLRRHRRFGSGVEPAALTLAIPFVGCVGSVFGHVPLSALEMGAVIGIVVGYIVAIEVAKARFSGSAAAPVQRASHELHSRDRNM